MNPVCPAKLPQSEPCSNSELVPEVYEELRKLAAQKMAREAPGQTLQRTALVHEAWLRLGGPYQKRWQNRAHFFAAAAEAMRRILIDNARRKKAACHGGHLERINVEPIELPDTSIEKDDQLLAVDEALDRLTAHDSIKAELVKLRYFVGLTNEQAAEVLRISQPTAKRYWAYARAWLYREIKESRDGGEVTVAKALTPRWRSREWGHSAKVG